MQQASYLEEGPLFWILPLYLHIDKKSDEEDDDDEGLSSVCLNIGTPKSINYAPNFREVEEAYWFGPVRPSVHPSVCQ